MIPLFRFHAPILSIIIFASIAIFSDLATATLSLCSTEDTSTTSSVSYLYNSNSWCSIHCNGYEYAIVYGESCGCSNDTPDDTDSLSNCELGCPGYPSELCGGSGGYYGYI
ncbi:hypothetical protein CANARDRAFT_194731, partial [[Candida] arabinofermentans NRRL YB-2248]